MYAHLLASRNSCLSCIVVNLSNRNQQSDYQVTQWVCDHVSLFDGFWTALMAELESVQTIIPLAIQNFS